MLEHIVRHGHPLQPRLSPDVTMFSCHWTLTFKAERVGLSPCNGFSTKKSFMHTSHCAPPSSQHPVTSHFILLHQVIHDSHSSQAKSCGDGGMAKQQVEVTTGSCSHDPARRQPWTSGRSSLYPGYQRSPAASWATEQPFLGQHCSP